MRTEDDSRNDCCARVACGAAAHRGLLRVAGAGQLRLELGDLALHLRAGPCTRDGGARFLSQFQSMQTHTQGGMRPSCAHGHCTCGCKAYKKILLDCTTWLTADTLCRHALAGWQLTMHSLLPQLAVSMSVMYAPQNQTVKQH